MKTLVESYEQAPKAYEPINTGLSEFDIQGVMNLFDDYIHLPFEERRLIHWSDASRSRTSEAGYMYRDSRKTRDEDNKHVFHMSSDLIQNSLWFDLHKLPIEANRFYHAAREIHDFLGKAACAKYQELEEDMPGIERIHFPRSHQSGSHTRFLAYRDANNGVLASGHYDKSTGTIAVAESHGGLRVGFGPDDLEQIDRSQYEPIFFPSYGYHQLAEILDVPVSRRAAWHDVVDSGQRVSEDVTRWALVHFINPANLYLDSTKEQTHTPIPWRGLGKLALRSDDKSFLVD